MNQLKEYIIALTHLYGIVDTSLIVEIYNQQNKDQVYLSDVENFLFDPPNELEDAFVHSYEGFFVHEGVLDSEEFESLMIQKQNKPYYVPKKSKLLCYVEDGYFEITEHYLALVKFVKQHYVSDEKQLAEWLAEDVQGYCQYGFDMQYILSAFYDRGISLEDDDHVEEILQLVTNLKNNTRIWENNGYTPSELFNIMQKDAKTDSANKTYDPFGLRKEKIGRNEPCPCGSGKKYKKCCMLKKS